jgi:hypothetical protein
MQSTVLPPQPDRQGMPTLPMRPVESSRITDLQPAGMPIIPWLESI